MLAILFICLIVFGAISLPIGIAMGLATMLCLVFATNIDPIMIAQNAFAGIDSFSLMAIPFFMLAGNFMRYGGISKRLLDLADNIVGFFTGGLGAITTFTAMFYAAISGSGPATVSAIGSFMIPEMEEKGYDKGYATALSAAAGTIGVIIPPSIPFVIYGVATGTSIGDLFKAGVLPGLVMGIALMVYNWYICKRHGWKGNGRKFSFKEMCIRDRGRSSGSGRSRRANSPTSSSSTGTSSRSRRTTSWTRRCCVPISRAKRSITANTYYIKTRNGGTATSTTAASASSSRALRRWARSRTSARPSTPSPRACSSPRSRSACR